MLGNLSNVVQAMVSRYPQKPRVADYPLDLDGSERFTRFATGVGIFPRPPMIGSISGILPLMDDFFYASGYAPPGYGPSANPAPVNLQWQAMFPGLTKQMGLE